MRTLIAIVTATVVLCGAFFAVRGRHPDARADVEPRGGLSHEFRRGDTNDDGEINISDPIFLLSHLFAGGPAPPCRAASDADDDGSLTITDAIVVLAFLFRGDGTPAPPFPDPGPDPTPDLGCREPPLPPLPPPGSLGGPDRELDPGEAMSWRRGKELFDRPATIAAGLGPRFNGDSCRGCHLDPVIGGSGGIDVDVVRFAYVDPEGVVSPLPGGPAVSRLSIPGFPREEAPAEANVMETRQTPTLLGLGLVDRLPDAVLLENADPDDAGGDGVSGRARMVGHEVGRFGHKAGVPSLLDFAADALLNEIGLTVDPAHSAFAGAADEDGAEDPEVADADFLDLVFFLSHLAPPPRRIPEEPAARAAIEEGEAIFTDIGCAACHVPALEGPEGPVPAFSDFLLHDVADPDRHHVIEDGVEPREFRTAPLWGLRDTEPYLHDGSAETIEEAIILGHHGEAQAARESYEALESEEKTKLRQFLESL